MLRKSLLKKIKIKSYLKYHKNIATIVQSQPLSIKIALFEIKESYLCNDKK